MPRVRFLVDVPNWRGNPAAFVPADSELDVTAEEAKAWADGERAELVRQARQERATK